MGSADCSRAYQDMVKHERCRFRARKQKPGESRRDLAKCSQATGYNRPEPASPIHPKPVLREGDAQAHARLELCKASERTDVERAHEAPLEETEPIECARDLGNRARGLEIDVDAHVVGVFRKEGKRFVERGKLGADLAKFVEPQRSHRPAHGAVTHFVEIVGMGDDERAARELEHVEFDEIHACLDCRPERAKRVLRSQSRCAAVPDPERPPVASLQRDHGVGSGRVGR